mgnify:CR=1 FL=1|jgi:hypothetical protein
MPQMRARHELIKKLDPAHVSYSVLDQAPQIEEYVGISEALGVDVYPWHGSLSDNLTQSYAAFDFLLTSIKGREDRVGICVPQYFGWQNYDGNPAYTLPPAAAMRAMAFGGIARGCKGLLLYSYYDLFQTTSPEDAPYQNRTRASAEVIAARLLELQLFGREVRALEPILLQDSYNGHLKLGAHAEGVVGGLRCPPPPAAKAVSGAAEEAEEAEQAEAECTLFLVNLTPEPQRAQGRVDLSALTAGRRDGTSFAQFLAPYGVAITGVSLA